MITSRARPRRGEMAPAIANAASAPTNACDSRSAVSSARPTDASDSSSDARVASSPASSSPAASPMARPSAACASTSSTATAGPASIIRPIATKGTSARGHPGGKTP